jgi:hypothetical protein
MLQAQHQFSTGGVTLGTLLIKLVDALLVAASIRCGKTIAWSTKLDDFIAESFMVCTQLNKLLAASSNMITPSHNN